MAQINKPSLHFNTKLYTGNGADNHAITGVGFAPDLVWAKRRDSNNGHVWFDKVRGATKIIQSDNSSAQLTSASGKDTVSLDSDGFTVAVPQQTGGINPSGASCVSWNWKANGQGSSNTAGSINTTYTSVNTTAGFSISSYAGSGGNGNFGHGLGVKPAMFMIKRLNATEDWAVYHQSMTASHYLNFNTTASKSSNNRFDGEPSSTLISLQNHTAVNASGSNYVCYAFAEKKGYSKFGKYVGNGADDGPFIYCGFKPAFVIYKNSSYTANWYVFDNKRSPFNLTQTYLKPNANAQEDATSSDIRLDLLSNGFKMRGANNAQSNHSGNDYIYMAFAENPIVGSNKTPATAR